MARVTPPLSTYGIFTLRAPFVADGTIAYRVGAIRTFDSIVSQGIDPVKLVYTPAGLGSVEYQEDKLAGAAIVTLLSATQDPLHVPDTYIVQFPNVAISPHSWMVASISLGMLPDTYDLTRVKAAIAAAVVADVGVEAEVRVSSVPVTQAITYDQYQQNLAARQAAITNTSTDFADKQALMAELSKLRLLNAQYIEMIEQLQNP